MFLKTTSVNKGVKSASYDVLMKAREKVGKMQTGVSHTNTTSTNRFIIGNFGENVSDAVVSNNTHHKYIYIYIYDITNAESKL